MPLNFAPVLRGLSLLIKWAFPGRGLMHAVNSPQNRVLIDRYKVNAFIFNYKEMPGRGRA